MSVSAPGELLGKRLALVVDRGLKHGKAHSSISWWVRGFGGGRVRLEATSSRHKSEVDWQELRDDIEARRIEVC